MKNRINIKLIIKSLFNLLIYCSFTISIEILFSFIRTSDIKPINVILATIFGFTYWLISNLTSWYRKTNFDNQNKKEE